MQNNNSRFEKILEENQLEKTNFKGDDEQEATLIKNIQIKIEKINNMIHRAQNA